MSWFFNLRHPPPTATDTILGPSNPSHHRYLQPSRYLHWGRAYSPRKADTSRSLSRPAIHLPELSFLHDIPDLTLTPREPPPLQRARLRPALVVSPRPGRSDFFAVDNPPHVIHPIYVQGDLVAIIRRFLDDEPPPNQILKGRIRHLALGFFQPLQGPLPGCVLASDVPPGPQALENLSLSRLERGGPRASRRFVILSSVSSSGSSL